jgi:hypothetical protein
MKSFLFLVFNVCFSICHASNGPFPAPPAGSLFSSQEALSVVLNAPLSTLIKAKDLPFLERKKFTVPGQLSYVGKDGKAVNTDVQIHLKGFTTLSFCPFPKMEMKLVNPPTGSVFATIKTVDFNTHCAEPTDTSINEFYRASFYNHREVLAYQMMNLLKIPSYQARAVWVQYIDTDSPSKINIDPAKPYRAFFLEDMGDFKKRVNVQEIKDSKDPMKAAYPPDKQQNFIFRSAQESANMDPEDVARVELLESLVGNGDWFLRVQPSDSRGHDTPEGLWNIKILETPERKWIPMAQDFSLSALVVGTPYGIASLRQFNLLTPESKERLKKEFLDHRSELYQLLTTLSQDSPGAENAKVLLDQFFQRLQTL